MIVAVHVNGELIDEDATFLVMPKLPYPVIIGLGFLKENSASLVFGPDSNRLVLGDHVFESHFAVGSQFSEVPAFVAARTRINGRHESVIRIKVPGAKDGSVYVVSGLPSLSSRGLRACHIRYYADCAEFALHNWWSCRVGVEVLPCPCPGHPNRSHVCLVHPS